MVLPLTTDTVHWPLPQLRYGQETEVFKRYPEPARSHLSFSLIYTEEGEQRTLDMTCDSERDFEYWYFGIKVRARPAVPLEPRP